MRATGTTSASWRWTRIARDHGVSARGGGASRARRPKATIGGERVVAAEARDLHERLGPGGRRGACASSRSRSATSSSSTTSSTSPPAKVRVKMGGGNAGHNGLRSITALCGNDYRRVRLGIGHPGDKDAGARLCAAATSARPSATGWRSCCDAVAEHRRCWRQGDDGALPEQGRQPAPASGELARVKGAAGAGSCREGSRRRAAARAVPARRAPGSYSSRGLSPIQPSSRRPTDRRTEELDPPMGFKCGIVGLPNVGKSTLFNALTQTAAAQAANYPFCTIEPNVGDVAVPDPRLDKLARDRRLGADHPDAHHLRRHRRPGARRLQGRGAGQPVPGQHPRGRRHRPRGALLRGRRHHPRRGQGRSRSRHRDHRDRADAGRPRQPGEARRRRWRRRPRAATRRPRSSSTWSTARSMLLREGKPARMVERKAEEERPSQALQLLTAKPVLYVCNVEEASAASGNALLRQGRAARQGGRRRLPWSSRPRSRARSPCCRRGAGGVPGGVGLDEPGLNRVIRAGYALLDLVTYFTVGPKEARAWTITARHQGARRRPASSTPTSRRASSAPRPSPTTTTSPARARPARARPASCGWKARSTSSRTATCMHFRFAN